MKNEPKRINENQINFLLTQRDMLIDINTDDNKIMKIQKEVQKSIRQNFNSYACDFIIETWTKFGASPQLIYNDNGLFAVNEQGLCIKKKNVWKKSIRLALKYYINN